jgi:predicted NAD/FAD-binding protein
MRIAIVGAGISGLVCAHLLRRRHDVTVFEAGGYVGGHTHTVPVRLDGAHYHVDTGFIVFNEHYYPLFTRLLAELGVASQPTTMSLSVRCDESGLEYCGKSLGGLFAQPSNLVKPAFYQFLREVLRFQKQGVEALAVIDDTLSVAAFVERYGYSRNFLRWFLVPMGSALWSAPAGEFERYPIRFVIQFFRNHGMMQVLGRPDWRVIQGGSFRYVEKLTQGWGDTIRLNTPVRRVERAAAGVTLRLDSGAESFDEVIFACHSDQALAMLAAPTPVESEILSHFPYQENDTILHTDTAVLPRSRRAWGCWNYHLSERSTRAASVTYNMNMLQSLRAPHTFCVSLNEEGIREDRILKRIRYHHPVFRAGREAMQARHPELIRHHRASYCGAYWGFGFHEDGVRSAVHVCQAFGETL